MRFIVCGIKLYNYYKFSFKKYQNNKDYYKRKSNSKIMPYLEFIVGDYLYYMERYKIFPYIYYIKDVNKL